MIAFSTLDALRKAKAFHFKREVDFTQFSVSFRETLREQCAGDEVPPAGEVSPAHLAELIARKQQIEKALICEPDPVTERELLLLSLARLRLRQLGIALQNADVD